MKCVWKNNEKRRKWGQKMRNKSAKKQGRGRRLTPKIDGRRRKIQTKKPTQPSGFEVGHIKEIAKAEKHGEISQLSLFVLLRCFNLNTIWMTLFSGLAKELYRAYVSSFLICFLSDMLWTLKRLYEKFKYQNVQKVKNNFCQTDRHVSTS